MISGQTLVAGVVGSPVAHSLSPLIQNAWLGASAVDGVYVTFSPPADRFLTFAEGLRGGAVRGLNVTVPFKEQALGLADQSTERAHRAGAANLLLFTPDGPILADNTDGLGMMAAFAQQAPGFDPAAGPVVIFGAGGAARGAVAAFLEAGAPEIRIINRSPDRARLLAATADPVCVAEDAEHAFEDANAVINATTLGLGGGDGPLAPFERAPDAAVVLDMVYRPLRTRFLQAAARRGLRTVDGLEMLIGQAAPSFEALFNAAAPPLDVRTLALRALGEPA